jgi:hypothetical protein
MTFSWPRFAWVKSPDHRSRERIIADLAAEIDHRLELRRIGRDQRQAEARARETERVRLQVQRDPILRRRK